jgi:hypothetical protein
MAGILSNMPQGILDPRSAMAMQMGMGLLAAGGPSRTPVSFGQSLGQAGMQGMQAFQQASQAQQQEALRQMQMKKIEEDMRLAQEKAAQPPRPIVASPGAQFVHPVTGEVLHTVPFKPEEPKPPAAPFIKTFREGDQDVTKEYRDGKWIEVSRGQAFAPKGTASIATPKAPTGFRYTPDGSALEPIPGGPKDTAPKEAARAQGAVRKADTVIRKVDEALGLVGPTTTGLIGDLRSTMLGRITGSGAFDLEKTIDTIKANLGFSELQAMREASPTGGALGQVAVQELNMLQSTIASLDKGQDDEIVRRNLEQVKQHFQNWKAAVEQAQAEGGAQSAVQPAAPTAPAMNKMPPAKQHKGRIIEDNTGKRFKSDGMSWRPL